MAAKKIAYTATAPDGTVATRGSARTYTHAVFLVTVPADGGDDAARMYSCWGWCGRPDLADKQAASLSKMTGRVLNQHNLDDPNPRRVVGTFVAEAVAN